MVKASDDGRLDTLADQSRHRLAGDTWSCRGRRAARAGPTQELAPQRLVEAELGADLRDLLGRGVVAGDDGGGIAGDRCSSRKTKTATTAMTSNDREQASDDVGAHG